MPFSAEESRWRTEEVLWRERAPEGKLDLLVTLELRMSTSALYSDVVLPAAGWYEMHDLNTTDLHTFIHPFNPAVDPVWEAKDQLGPVQDHRTEILGNGGAPSG